VTLPDGCLGAATPLTLPGEQMVAIRDERLARLIGAPVGLARADALIGYRGADLHPTLTSVTEIAADADEAH